MTNPEDARPFIHVDWNNRDADGMLRLNIRGALNCIEEQQLTLYDGMEIRIPLEAVEMDAIVRAPGREGVWRAEVCERDAAEAWLEEDRARKSIGE